MGLRERISEIMKESIINAKGGFNSWDQLIVDDSLKQILVAFEESLPLEMPHPSDDFNDGGDQEYRFRREQIDRAERTTHNYLLSCIKQSFAARSPEGGYGIS